MRRKGEGAKRGAATPPPHRPQPAVADGGAQENERGDCTSRRSARARFPGRTRAQRVQRHREPCRLVVYRGPEAARRLFTVGVVGRWGAEGGSARCRRRKRPSWWLRGAPGGLPGPCWHLNGGGPSPGGHTTSLRTNEMLLDH